VTTTPAQTAAGSAPRPRSPLELGARRAARRLVSLASHPFGTVTHVATRQPVAALTFDDGPDPETTPRVAELLEAHGARGTFFMVGKAAARHPEVVRRVAEAGHAVGNHSWDHPSFPLIRGRWRRTQIRWCAEALAPWGLPLFRPPYGHQTPASQLDAVRSGQRVIGWNLIAEDWRDDPPEALVERVMRRFEPGSIALFHDALYSTVDRRYRDRGPTLAAVEELLERLGGSIRFVTVPELLRLGRPRKWPWYARADLDWLHRLE
jgi:peptidoglycan/xylan/chitin deacetylase (PgdA/CDA1 family)